MQNSQKITEGQSKLVDMEQGMRERGYDKEFFSSLLRMYGDQLSEDIIALKNAGQINNRITIRAIFHRLRGSAGYCYLTHLSEVMQQVHEEVKQNEKKDIEEILAPFYPAAEETLVEIKRILNSSQ